MTNNYHQYFIRDGQHIGHYDIMYENCADPWHIETLGLRLDMKAAVLLLSGYEKKINSFLDIGAGLGLFTGALAQSLWLENPQAIGTITDISPSAVARAEMRLADPRLSFMALDARSLDKESVFPPENFNLIIMAQVLWGLLENLDNTLKSLASLLTPHGFMLISQHFPGAANQSYGADIVSSPADLGRYLAAAGLEIVHTLETDRFANHHWAALVRKIL